jgi:3-hydroxy-3-methylglutaryl CoA synthase
MFSYGSGLAASLFSVKLKSAEGLKKIAETSNFQARLAQRKKVAPADFVDALKRYQLHLNHARSRAHTYVDCRST